MLERSAAVLRRKTIVLFSASHSATLRAMSSPTSTLEHSLRLQFHGPIAGADEVGCGALAGPVIAAAVILPPRSPLPGLNDSKLLSAGHRERLALRIKETALAWAIGEASVEEILTLNIRQASLLASRRAIESLHLRPAAVISDAFLIPGLSVPCFPHVRADQRHRCVAAASILAKVHRDALMIEQDRFFPSYGFAKHKGYGTAIHLKALRETGPSPLHRAAFLRNLRLAS